MRKIARIETFFAPPRWLFVRVESDEGAVGWGEASLEGWAEAVDGVFEAFRDRFIGADPFAIEDIWLVGYRGVQFYVHLDRLLRPAHAGYFLEVKSRTWSRRDAQDKAAIIVDLLERLGARSDRTVAEDYVDLPE